jgi:hypothetical protein
MNLKILIIGILVLVLSAISVNYTLNNMVPDTTENPEENYACTMEAKMCPDGSYVGRTGPKCEFEQCPSPSLTSVKVTTKIGQSSTGLNVTINPTEVISDSRCPMDVQCIWAGTVEVKTTLSTQVSHGEHVLKLGEPQNFGNYTVTLTEVSPDTKAGIKIQNSLYKFIFEVKNI